MSHVPPETPENQGDVLPPLIAVRSPCRSPSGIAATAAEKESTVSTRRSSPFEPAVGSSPLTVTEAGGVADPGVAPRLSATRLRPINQAADNQPKLPVHGVRNEPARAHPRAVRRDGIEQPFVERIVRSFGHRLTQ